MSFEINIICVQMLPIHFEPLQSMEKASLMLSAYSSADIVVLPEMAFSGYSFQDKNEISPLLEEPNSLYPTFQWCAQEAKRLNAYIFCGYPERCGDHAYNSMMVIAPSGDLVQTYRKSFLYEMDKSWASEGDGFKTVEITIRNKAIKLGLGICMDINPYEFTAPFGKFELSTFWKNENVDLCVFCTNWTASGESNSMNLMNYWVTRLTPLLVPDKIRYFIAADRIGLERGTGYEGTSCVLKICNKPQIVASLDTSSERILNCIIKI